jgi:hypothetical protein
MPYHPAGLGRAYNDHCSIVPNEDDWICITDTDVMFFSSQKLGEQIADAIERNPEYQVFTCPTNRICNGCEQQLRVPGIRDARDLVALKREADRQMSLHRGVVTPVRGFFAGYFLLFRKSVWKQIPFPDVGSQGGSILGIDSTWAKRIHTEGIQVGLIRGLVATHFYRLDKGEGDLSHLSDPGHNSNQPHEWMPGPAPVALGAAATPRRVVLNENLIPPGGFWMLDEDNIRHESHSAAQLCKTLAAHRARLGRPPGNPLQELTEQIYARHPRCCLLV